jgi:hypothetical protein
MVLRHLLCQLGVPAPAQSIEDARVRPHGTQGIGRRVLGGVVAQRIHLLDLRGVLAEEVLEAFRVLGRRGSGERLGPPPHFVAGAADQPDRARGTDDDSGDALILASG